ncbi:hypothetical protein BDB00DRAFT_609791 [Zychaea mexicana]|uniref:uncharacterized protein n=1 Tax=Zychaea mexicana TaxID=64656 RepID=UPI0022FE9BE6|nr:uncharacterized protein BDB00DRAFT_609791 [Zychaea mexicana]KAI9489581.1 hypothetical protein BDB00DRAFT_609791 [Zychaea mexicana]
MSDVKYTSRSFDAFPSQQVPTSPPPPPPEHRYFTSSPPSLNSPSTSDSYDTENPASTNTTPDSRSTSVFTQQQPNDHHHGNAPTADETASGVNSSPNLPRAFSLSSLIRDEEQPEDPEHPQVISISTSNPSHLFWVPATQHPELAPNEFEKFLHTNSHAKRERASLRRRSSILSVSFTASDALKQDDDEGMTEGDSRKDTLEALERGKSQQSSEYSEQYHQQKQHNSSRSGDAEGLPRKTRLRRSISLDMATAAENQLRVPDFLVFDRNSSPLDQSRVLVPRADRPSLLRRGARTKFQRNSSFTPPSARQVDRHRQTESMPPGTYTERLDHSTLGEGGITLSDSPLAEPPLNMSLSIAEPSPPPLPQSTSAHAMFSPRPMERRASAEEVPRLQNSSTPSKDHEVQGLEIGQNVVTQELEPLEHQSHEQQQQQQQHQLDPPARASSERKSSWSWGFKRSKSEQVRSDVISDKVHLQAELMPRPRPSVSSESSGSAATPSGSGNGVAPLAPNSNSSGGKDSSGKRSFGLSSLFSRKSSSNKAQATAEPAAQNTAPIPPKDFQLNRINQNRLPIHIERAIYRLSHSKLANPRRPLHQQEICQCRKKRKTTATLKFILTTPTIVPTTTTTTTTPSTPSTPTAALTITYSTTATITAWSTSFSV